MFFFCLWLTLAITTLSGVTEKELETRSPRHCPHTLRSSRLAIPDLRGALESGELMEKVACTILLPE